LGTEFQNTLNYDVWLTVYLAITANTSLVIEDGVGPIPAGAPTLTTIISGTTVTGIIGIRAKIPVAYQRLLSVSGTGTAVFVGQYLEAT
jgi:hypothetical protein